MVLFYGFVRTNTSHVGLTQQKYGSSSTHGMRTVSFKTTLRGCQVQDQGQRVGGCHVQDQGHRVHILKMVVCLLKSWKVWTV